MDLNTYYHYKNSLAIQFGMSIAENAALIDAYDAESEELDALFDEWVQAFDKSDADDSWEFFQSYINDWINERIGKNACAELTASSIHPGDIVFAIVQEKKLNRANRWIRTKNFAVKQLHCTDILFSDDIGTAAVVITGFVEYEKNKFVFYDVPVTDCFVTASAAQDELDRMRGEIK